MIRKFQTRKKRKGKKSVDDARPPQCRPYYYNEKIEKKKKEDLTILKKIEKSPSKNNEGLVDLCILVSRRLEFTKLCFEALIQNTKWALVKRVIIMHDIPKTLDKDILEEDLKSREFLKNQIKTLTGLGVGVSYIESGTGSVGLCMKYSMCSSDALYYFKIDNDVVVGKNYLDILLKTMESYEELVVLGYGRIWEKDFLKNQLVVKKGLDYGYMRCVTGHIAGQDIHFNVGGLVLIRMIQKLKDQLENFICRDTFFGWPTFQIYHIKEKIGTVGWHWPNIDNTIIMDFLQDRELVEQAGLDYNRLLELVDKYYKKGLARRSKDFALKSTQKMKNFEYLIDSCNAMVINKNLRKLREHEKEWSRWSSNRFKKFGDTGIESQVLPRIKVISEYFKSTFKPDFKILDIGCGTGRYYGVMKDLGLVPFLKYVGIDTTRGMINEACRRYKEADFRLGDAYELNFPNQSFDMCFLIDIIQRMPDYQPLIKEMYRVSKKYMIIATLWANIEKDYHGDTNINYRKSVKKSINKHHFLKFLKTFPHKNIHILEKGIWVLEKP